MASGKGEMDAVQCPSPECSKAATIRWCFRFASPEIAMFSQTPGLWRRGPHGCYMEVT